MRNLLASFRSARLLFTSLLLSAICFNQSGFSQTLIAGWDFQTTTNGGTAVLASPNTPKLYTANVGTGTLYLDGTNGSSNWVQASELNAFAGTALNAGGATGLSTTTTSPACLAPLGGTSLAANGKFMVFKFSMTGLTNLVVSYATQRTTTGFNSHVWEYSTNGTSWTPAQTLTTIPTAFAVQTLTTITGLDNAATAYLRWSGTGATNATGNNRLDNIQLNASAPTTFSLTYSGNTNTSGTAPTDGNSPYSSGATVTVLGNTGSLAKTGYTFSGWNTLADGSGTDRAPASTFSMPAANTTLFAKWVINTYTVTYDGNTNDGGSAPVDGSSPYNYNSNVTVLGQGTLTKTGFSFNGWNTAADGSGTPYAAAATINGIAANVTLFAQWIPDNTYSVTYNGNGNDGGSVPVDGSSPYASGSNVTVLGQGTLTRTGYTFTGWNTDAGGSGTGYSSGGTISNISANTILYAQWQINTYTVTYDGNTSDGGTAPVDGSSPYNYNSNVTVLSQGTLTKTNYNFTGWNTDPGGNGTAYAAGSTITGIAANVTLYAQWAIITYTVTYNGNTNTGGTAPVDGSSPYAIGSNVTVLGQGTLVKTGYTFTGWNTLADGTGTPYAAAGTISNLSANTVLFAQWSINTYTVTYDGNGNTGGSAPVDGLSPYNFGSIVTVLANTGSLVKTGSTFAGWNTAANGSGTNYAATGSATFTLGAANVVLYAKWAEPLYEAFNYTAGDNIGGNSTATSGGSNNNWTTHSNTSGNSGVIGVTAGSLSYTGLQASTGNKVRLPGSNTTTPRDINRPVTVAGSVGYYSFLLNVADNTQLGTGGDYFTGFGGTAGTSVTALYARLNIKSVNAGANFRLAISNSTGGTPTFTDFATDLSFGTTYLVVIKYDFNGASPDIATLWVNPSSLGGSEPAGGVTNSSGTTGQTTFASVFLRNTTATPKADIDEIRVGSTWAEVTPPGNYTITASAGPNGTISPNGATVLSPGGSQTYTITPSSSPCYDVADVLVDGVSVGAVKTYTFTNVSADHTISASFVASSFTQWTGTASTDWNDPANWTSCVPNSSLYVYVPENGNAGVTQQPVLTGDASTGDLELGPGATLTIGSNTLTINGSFADDGGSSLIGSPTSNLVFANGSNLSSASTIVLKNLTVNGGLLTLQSAVEITGGTAANTSGTVTVASGATIDAGGFLTLKSNQYGTARVAAGDIAGNYITGNVTVERYIPANSFRSWRLLSVPTFGANETFKHSWQENNTPLGNIKPNFGTQITGTGLLATAQANGFDNIAQQPALLKWNVNAWQGITNTNSTTIDTKAGYFLYIRGERTQGITNSSSSPTATTLRTTGQLYQGDQTALSFAANSFNLVGNVYASAINFTQLGRTGGVDNLFYVWDSKKLNGTSLGQYQTFSATNSFNCIISGGSYALGQPNTKIEAGQAFFVQTTSAGTLTLTEASKISNSANLGFRPVKPASSLVKIDSRLYAGNSTDIADANVVVFDNIYTNAVSNEDAVKLSNSGENFGISQGGKTLAIEGRHTIAENDVIEFNMWNLKEQQYKLEIVPQNMATPGLTAMLEDSYLKTNMPVSLDVNTEINFTVDANAASRASNRFRIIFSKPKPVAAAKQGFTIAPNPVEGGNVSIMFGNQKAGRYNVRIVNSLGQTISTHIINHAGGSSSHLLALPEGINNGMHRAEIIAPNKTKTVQQLFVNLIK